VVQTKSMRLDMAAIHSSMMVKSVCGMPLQGIMEQGVQSN